MKHSYRADCDCKRCARERKRRAARAALNDGIRRLYAQRSRKPRDRRPAPGSQQWAETRGDDIGESPDY